MFVALGILLLVAGAVIVTVNLVRYIRLSRSAHRNKKPKDRADQ